MSIANQHAFPVPSRSAYCGLTKREHFVLELLKAYTTAQVEGSHYECVAFAQDRADALIAALEAQK